MGHLKLSGAFAAAFVLAACSTTDTNDKYSVGVDDNDRFASSTQSDTELSDAQQFGIDDDDQYEARVVNSTTTTPRTAVASRVVRADDTIYTGFAYLPEYSAVANEIESTKIGSVFDGLDEYTLFAPSNTAISYVNLDGVPVATKTQVLKYHAVAGRIDSQQLSDLIDKNGGTLTVTTLSGDDLKFMKMGDAIKVSDKNGYTFNVVSADNEFKNGYVHGIDGVLGYDY